ncbi:MAG: methylated-DNA--[protein]-cysteine S-methyltransferase [Alphaproteobacteria bacterium]|nr:methylated-DNA--[protein]-cysteine S-methyltransferase [Alphaproteobacteria bacterium]
MTARGFSLFDTAIGRCGIAWGEHGIVGIQLPEASDSATRERMLHRFPAAGEAAAPPEIQRAVHAIAALLRGEASDLSSIPLDLKGVPPFHRRVYDIARSIPPGQTLSYGDIAARLGSRAAARAVGQALGQNPVPIVVPCHRVLAAGGKPGGFSAHGGTATKLRMLAIESVRANGVPDALNLQARLCFDPGVAVEHLRMRDAALARIIDTLGPLRMQLHRTSSTFGALAEAIVYQQLTGKAAAKIFARLCALFPPCGGCPTAEQVLGASEEELRGVGLSRSKILSLRDLAAKAVSGEVPTLCEIRGMEDEAIIDRLVRVRGIGRWTAEMLLIFHLGRADVLPVDDYGVRKGFALAYERGLPTPKELADYGTRWKPYRTVASWYLWRVVERATARRVMPVSGNQEGP